MYEVEVKVRADHDEVAARLETVGACERGTVEQADTYFDAPHREFAETDEALRVRRETRDGEESAYLTYKGPRVDAESKTREEVETGVVDADATEKVLAALGFEPAATVRKQRRRYEVEGYTVTLDSVEGLGEFVEVETEVEEDEVDSAREGAFDVLRLLGLNPDDQVRASYLGLLLA